MQVRFYLDPICPWCWITSRWLVEEVAPKRDLDVDWRSISLLVRNEKREMSDERRDRYRRTHNLLRIVEAVRAAGHTESVGDLYTEFGERIHRDRDFAFDPAGALASVGVDPAFATSFDDDSLDAAVRRSTEEAEAVAGDDVGTPIIAYEVRGEWKGYFGPVIPDVIRGDDALRLWDGLSMLIETDGFYELKSHRPSAPQIPGRA